MSWWRSLLNLPPKGEHWSDQRRAKRSDRGRPEAESEWWTHPEAPVATSAHRQTQGTASPYSPAPSGVMTPPRRPQQPAARAASVEQDSGRRSPERLQQRSPHRTHDTPQPSRPLSEPSPIPWATEPESSFTTWARRFFRGLVVAVLILAAISGVRSWIRPDDNAATVVTGESGFPEDDARAVATRFSASYLTWDEADAAARPAAIALDLADGLDDRVGWNGRGRQTTGAAYPGEVTVDPGGVTAKVDVRILVRPSTRSGRAWVTGQPVWQRLSVPVARTPARVVVSGPPTFVPDERAALPDDMPEAGVPDDDLTAATASDAEAFFGAYAESDAKVAAVTAPGASIRSLNGTVKLDELTDWQVYTGNDDERRATAAVIWDGTGDTTLAQTYTLTLRRTVAADGAQRWQVAAVG
ncbi:MAG TPA: conjugal transfer protein [Kribbella sp.]|nr:conjugal transfer protein [Kribbella sp.]